MGDAKPVLMILVLSGCGLLWLSLHWFGTPRVLREQRLTQIAIVEEAPTLPPRAGLDQVGWLLDHRRTRLQGLVGLAVVGVVIGLVEGCAQRRQERQAGLGVWHWTIGVVTLALLPGAVGALVLSPVPWSLAVVAGIAPVWASFTAYMLSKGRPYVA